MERRTQYAKGAQLLCGWMKLQASGSGPDFPTTGEYLACILDWHGERKQKPKTSGEGPRCTSNEHL